MLFNSDSFIFLFLPIWLALFACIQSRYRSTANYLILAASLVFYGSWNPSNLPLLAASVAVNYLIVVGLHKLSQRRVLVILAVSANLGLLAYFKYRCFFGQILNLPACGTLPDGQELPLGISFFTFQQIAYAVDVYRHKEEDEQTPSFVDFASFVTFFPHLIAGPITRSNELLRPIRLQAYGFTSRTLEIGLIVFIVGLVRKVVFADPFAKIADAVFSAAASGPIDLLSGLLGILAFSLQIYFDFSGYSEMAVGLALMIGIQLPWNFDIPYRASSPIEFWRRWHITLSTLLRDYLYIPLGGNRHGEARKYLNIMVTMVLGGLWHGASWTFVFWGFLHGSLLAATHLWKDHMRWELPVLPAVLLTNIAVALAWVFFRAPDFATAANVFSSLVAFNGVATANGLLGPFSDHVFISNLAPHNRWQIAGLFCVLGYWLAATVRTQQLAKKYLEHMENGSVWRLPTACIGAIVAATALFVQSGSAEKFIYFDF